MAKKRKKLKHLKFAGFRIPAPLIGSLVAAGNTPLGRIIVAEALVHAASILVRKPATVAAAGGEALGAAKHFGEAASEAAAKFMHATADHLKGDAGKHHKSGKKGDRSEFDKDAVRDADDRSEDFDGDMLQQAMLGNFSRKKKYKKGKAAKRH